MSSDGNWVTINGVHVLIGATGKVEKGPKNLIGKTYDYALSSAKGNSVPNQFKDTRVSNTVNVGDYVSLQSARADFKKVKETANNIEKQKKYVEKQKEYVETRKERVRGTLKYRYSDDDTKKVLRAEAEKQGLAYTKNGVLVSKKQNEGINRTAEFNKVNNEFNKRLRSATSEKERNQIIEEANKTGRVLSGDGTFVKSIPKPKYPKIKIKGLEIDLDTSAGRREAKLMKDQLSPKAKENFANFCLQNGLDPITLKPINN